MRQTRVPKAGSLNENPAPPTRMSGGFARGPRSVTASYADGAAVLCAEIRCGEAATPIATAADTAVRYRRVRTSPSVTRMDVLTQAEAQTYFFTVSVPLTGMPQTVPE